MIISSRREVVFNGLLTILFGSCCSTAAHAQRTFGCWIPPESTQRFFGRATRGLALRNGTEVLEPRSGDPSLDRALVRALARLSRLFDVLPGFSYYREFGSPNAQATDEQLLDRTDGTVMFGLTLLQQLMQRERPDASIVAVCAHEYGHILSYKNGMIRQLAPTRDEVFRAEQFADFMAGYYAGTRKLESPTFPAVVFATTQRFYGGGDHGSGQQRGEAVQTGFLAGYQQRMTAVQAADAALQFSLARSL
jgi:hypothetical protein